MYNKTTGPYFYKYGYTNTEDHEHLSSQYTANDINVDNKSISMMFKCTAKIIVQFTSGILMVSVSADDGKTIQDFICHRTFTILPGISYGFISVTPTCTCRIYYPQQFRETTVRLSEEHTLDAVESTFYISSIYSQYYNVKSPGYCFKGESHNFYELTYVDNGSLTNIVDGKELVTNEYEIILFSRRVFHSQQNNSSRSCSYLTIMFDMSLDNQDIVNRNIPADRSALNILNHFVNESSLDIPYKNDMMITYLKEIIIYMLQYCSSGDKTSMPTTPINQHFENELLNEIMNYCTQHIEEPLAIDSICKHFSISRSSLQKLFLENTGKAPKKYINEIKMAKSLSLIKEEKYSISDIAIMLGYSSIHYFSRKFNNYYGISPSEYAKKIYK